jgi:hypothetical protein
VASVAQGHPLTLVLAVAALQNASNVVSLKDELAKILHELTHYFLKGIANGNLRQAIELAAVTRRVDEPMLRHIYPRSDAGKIYDDLARLPFMEQRADGLKLHQVIAGAVLGTMDARDPDALADLRRSIWRYLQRRDLNSGQAPNWRSTVDMIYQIHNPVVREAFFPSGARPRIVEAGRPEDFPKVRDIAEQHDGPDMANIVSLWWQHLPQAFRIVRDEANQVVGFCFAADDRTVPHLLRRNDPLLDAWMGHAEGETNGRERSLFVRRWLSSDVGEAPGPDQGASWIDLKRSYLEMRPDLRRVYVCAHDPAPYGPALTELQFQVLGQLSVMGTNNSPTTAMLDFGTGSVDGWLSRLLAGEVDATVICPLILSGGKLSLRNFKPAY